MIPCAYFAGGECVETMEDHIRKGLELLERLYLERNYDSFLGRLTNVESEVAGDILRKAYVLHDVGKCLEVFQKRRAKFGFHWFYSYLVARTTLDRFGEAGEIASVAILLHHHDWILNKSPPKPENPKLCKGCLHLLENITMEKLSREIPWVEPQDAYSEAEIVFRKNTRAVYAFLLPIVVADNYAAACDRGGTGSILGKEILETLKVRGWDLAGYLSSGL